MWLRHTKSALNPGSRISQSVSLLHSHINITVIIQAKCTHGSPVKLNWPQSAPFRVSETRQGYVVVVVITVFTTVIIIITFMPRSIIRSNY